MKFITCMFIGQLLASARSSSATHYHLDRLTLLHRDNRSYTNLQLGEIVDQHLIILQA